MTRTKKPRKPTKYQSRVLAMIARHSLMKTFVPTRPLPFWHVEGIGEISHECAQALIRNGWVKGNRDGLPMFEETQTYRALTP